MDDERFDDVKSINLDRLPGSPSTQPATKSSLCAMAIAESSSDETTLASFDDDDDKRAWKSPKDADKRVGQQSPKKVQWQHPIQKTLQFHNNHDCTPSIRDATDKLLDLVEGSACKFNTKKSESSKRLEILESNVLENKKSAVWDAVDDNSRSESRNHPERISFVNGSFDFNPDHGKGVAFSSDDRFFDLEDELGNIRQQRSTGSEFFSKYKDWLRGSGSVFDRETPNLEREYRHSKNCKSLASEIVIRRYKKNESHPALPPDIKRKPHKTGSKANKAVPETVNISPKTEVNLRSLHQVFSGLTPSPGGRKCFHDESFADEKIPKTCMLSISPVLASKTRKIFKRLAFAHSASTLSTSMMTGESRQLHTPENNLENSAKASFYFADNRNSYVAYFQRGDDAHKCVDLYEQPSPSIFPTLESEVVVRIEASTISKADCFVRSGLWWGEDSMSKLTLPIVPGVAFCGIVHQIDKRRHRSGLKRGDRVIALVRVGANARHLCVHTDRVIKVATDLTDVRSLACLPEVYLTAFQSLNIIRKNSCRYRSSSLTGKSILVLGGETLLGRAVLELACASNAATVYATAPKSQFNLIEQWGAVPLEENPHHWFSLLKGRLDMLISVKDSTSDESELKSEHAQALNRKGIIVEVGKPERKERLMISLDNLETCGTEMDRKLYHYNVFDAWEKDPKQAKRDLSHLLNMLQKGFIRPKILKTVPLSKVAMVHNFLESKCRDGFMLCEPWANSARREISTSGIGFHGELASFPVGDGRKRKKNITESQRVAI
jgi:NADPH:quinone reductase-like Zn-dependent oxidoreductase